MATKNTGMDGAEQRLSLSFLISFKRSEARALSGRGVSGRKLTLNEQLLWTEDHAAKFFTCIISFNLASIIRFVLLLPSLNS